MLSGFVARMVLGATGDAGADEAKEGMSEVPVEGLAQSLSKTLGFDVTDTMPLLFKLCLHVSAALLFIAWIIAGIIGRMVGQGLRRAKFDETLTRFFAKLVRWLVLLLAALMCLSLFGVETTSFAALLGAASLAIGMGFQKTLGNFSSGVLLLVFRPYAVGDVVNVAGSLGKVHEIELFTTTLDTFDNRRIVIPNGTIFNAVIENISHHPHRRTDVDVGVSYSADIDRTREVLEAAARSVENGMEDPEPVVFLLGLGASSVDWSVRVWAKADDFGAVKQATIRAVKNALDAEGIEIPFPQMDVHLQQAAG